RVGDGETSEKHRPLPPSELVIGDANLRKGEQQEKQRDDEELQAAAGIPPPRRGVAEGAGSHSAGSERAGNIAFGHSSTFQGRLGRGLVVLKYHLPHGRREIR